MLFRSPRPGTDTASTEDVVRRMQSFFGSLPAAEFPHHVRFAPELARFTSDERFEFGVRTFLAGLQGRRMTTTVEVPPK